MHLCMTLCAHTHKPALTHTCTLPCRFTYAHTHTAVGRPLVHWRSRGRSWVFCFPRKTKMQTPPATGNADFSLTEEPADCALSQRAPRRPAALPRREAPRRPGEVPPAHPEAARGTTVLLGGQGTLCQGGMGLAVGATTPLCPAAPSALGEAGRGSQAVPPTWLQKPGLRRWCQGQEAADPGPWQPRGPWAGGGGEGHWTYEGDLGGGALIFYAKKAQRKSQAVRVRRIDFITEHEARPASPLLCKCSSIKKAWC